MQKKDLNTNQLSTDTEQTDKTNNIKQYLQQYYKQSLKASTALPTASNSISNSKSTTAPQRLK